jgi:hypothetical protein
MTYLTPVLCTKAVTHSHRSPRPFRCCCPVRVTACPRDPFLGLPLTPLFRLALALVEHADESMPTNRTTLYTANKHPFTTLGHSMSPCGGK